MIQDYLQLDKLPHIWCQGCGNGIVMNALLRAAEESGLDPDNTVLVSGIGCSSRMVGYTRFGSMHTVHGRALPVATGLKMARPDMNVIVISGDGDALAIGGNHFIHSCRRNIDLTMLIINNKIYGMTKGQFSPLTPENAITSTTVYGNMDRPFSCPELAVACGATYVARSSVYHCEMLKELIKRGIMNRGFSVIECLSVCPTHYGRANGVGSAVDMMRELRDGLKPYSGENERYSPEIIGELHSAHAPEYCAKYRELIGMVREKR